MRLHTQGALLLGPVLDTERYQAGLLAVGLSDRSMACPATAELSNLFTRDENTFSVGDTLLFNDVSGGSSPWLVRLGCRSDLKTGHLAGRSAALTYWHARHVAMLPGPAAHSACPHCSWLLTACVPQKTKDLESCALKCNLLDYCEIFAFCAAPGG